MLDFDLFSLMHFVVEWSCIWFLKKLFQTFVSNKLNDFLEILSFFNMYSYDTLAPFQLKHELFTMVVEVLPSRGKLNLLKKTCWKILIGSPHTTIKSFGFIENGNRLTDVYKTESSLYAIFQRTMRNKWQISILDTFSNTFNIWWSDGR